MSLTPRAFLSLSHLSLSHLSLSLLSLSLQGLQGLIYFSVTCLLSLTFF